MRLDAEQLGSLVDRLGLFLEAHPPGTRRRDPRAGCSVHHPAGWSRARLTRSWDGGWPAAITSYQTSPVSISAGPLVLDFLGWIPTSFLRVTVPVGGGTD
jgi:hypothetical protein